MSAHDLNAALTPGYTFGSGGHDDVKPTTGTAPAFLYPHHAPDVAAELIATARALVSPRGRGIYATDETPEGIEARLAAAAGAEPDAQEKQKAWTDGEKRARRRRWRECLYESIPAEAISGVILHSETLIDFALAPLLAARGVLAGVRADTDAHPLPISPREPATQGLDDLLPRLQRAHAAGARFAKWRAPVLCTAVAGGLPSHAALEAQAEALARFAAVAQQAGLVPIVEPDVDFSADADLARSVEVHVRIIAMIYARCAAYGVLTEGSLIKPSFPQPGLQHPSRASTTPEQIAEATATVLARALPVGVAGVVFLSGGLSDADAARYLHAVNALVNAAPLVSPAARLPPLTFSFGRGLQGDAMRRWVCGDEAGAQAAFAARARVCAAAARGEGGGGGV